MSAQEDFRLWLQGRPELQPSVDENRLGVMWAVASKADLPLPNVTDSPEEVALELLMALKHKYGD